MVNWREGIELSQKAITCSKTEQFASSGRVGSSSKMEHSRQNFVGSTIRKLRSARDLTQEMLSARCGVAGYEISRGTLAKIEAEIRGITDVELFVVARVLGVKIEELFPAKFALWLKAGGLD